MKRLIVLALLLLALVSCKNEGVDDSKPNVVATTTMISDLARQIGKDSIDVQGLMGSGVDPHLYKASEGDVSKLFNADLILYNGLHLEGKMGEVFEKMQAQNIKTVALAETLDPLVLLESEYFASNYDPHVWFNITYWRRIATVLKDELVALDPESKAYYEANYAAYIEDLNNLKDVVEQIISSLPEEKRYLVTAHDAFNYFGQAYGFEVVGLQGLSTATEAGVQDVQRLADFIIEKQIKAIFVESSVPQRTIEALQAAVRAKDFEVVIGGTLYSDALGSAGTDEGEYIGMFLSNVNTIVKGLK
ncbi:metal ABC transporter solute-binding protein, Zn/Mn family [Gilvibacter sediminis]|uniref:metal ABC transporter solute-binding protein, Zn/Mn family n=1 Tax=Gilvibacter sediminis TaxID=379071 RepID=UPI00234FD0F1|nr:zinc ABC transporter substrate-binding protein [Gilvibacter sediminis]MDC7996701.1 zinc ABC transporter substrate-binding protein [Gilvibacter sediminis]